MCNDLNYDMMFGPKQDENTMTEMTTKIVEAVLPPRGPHPVALPPSQREHETLQNPNKEVVSGIDLGIEEDKTVLTEVTIEEKPVPQYHPPDVHLAIHGGSFPTPLTPKAIGQANYISRSWGPDLTPYEELTLLLQGWVYQGHTVDRNIDGDEHLACFALTRSDARHARALFITMQLKKNRSGEIKLYNIKAGPSVLGSEPVPVFEEFPESLSFGDLSSVLENYAWRTFLSDRLIKNIYAEKANITHLENIKELLNQVSN